MTVRCVVQLSALALLSVAFTLDGSARAATLTGDSIQAQYYFPDTSTVYALATTPAPFIVGAGEEATMLVEGDTTLHFDFSANQLLITIDTPRTNPTWDSSFNGNPVTQNGPAFTVLSGNPFTTPTATASNGFLVSAILSGGMLFINWAGMSYDDGDTVTVTFAESPVPLPAALPLFAGGLGALGLLGWRRKRQRLSNQTA